MSSEKEILVAQKAAMFDLIQIIKQQPDKTYTVDEIEALIVAYIKGAEQRQQLTGRGLCSAPGSFYGENFAQNKKSSSYHPPPVIQYPAYRIGVEGDLRNGQTRL